MNTRYTALSTEQKLALTSEELDTAIQLEAAERGIPIPITFSEAINQMGYVGYSIPADTVGFYEIMVPGRHSGQERSGVAFKTEAEALSAIQGALAVAEDGYPVRKNVCCAGEFAVQKVYISHAGSKNMGTAVKQFEEDREPYEKLCEEVRLDLSGLRQAAYDERVLAEKRAKYLQLANGDEATAERFWNNLESKQWPAAEKKADNSDIGF